MEDYEKLYLKRAEDAAKTPGDTNEQTLNRTNLMLLVRVEPKLHVLNSSQPRLERQVCRCCVVEGRVSTNKDFVLGKP